jgi:hypothetical protein
MLKSSLLLCINRLLLRRRRRLLRLELRGEGRILPLELPRHFLLRRHPLLGHLQSRALDLNHAAQCVTQRGLTAVVKLQHVQLQHDCNMQHVAYSEVRTKVALPPPPTLSECRANANSGQRRKLR